MNDAITSPDPGADLSRHVELLQASRSAASLISSPARVLEDPRPARVARAAGDRAAAEYRAARVGLV